MSRVVVNEILHRSLVDEEFRRGIESDAGTVLADFDLTAEERVALLGRDVRAVSALARDPEAVPAIVLAPNHQPTDGPIIWLRADDASAAELARRGAEIVDMGGGGRVEAIRDLLSRLS